MSEFVTKDSYNKWVRASTPKHLMCMFIVYYDANSIWFTMLDLWNWSDIIVKGGGGGLLKQLGKTREKQRERQRERQRESKRM